jgi:hypothetical protein
MRWPFKRKMVGASLVAKERNEYNAPRVGLGRLANLQQKKQIKEIKSKLKVNGIRLFNTNLTVPLGNRQVIVRALDKVADEMQQKQFTLDEFKQNLIQNKVAKDDLTASVQVEWILKHPGKPFTNSEGIQLVPVGRDKNGKVKYTIKWKQLPTDYADY